MALRYLGFTKIPMIFYVRPRIMEITDSTCAIKIPFNRRTRNHLNSIYIGALVIGADLAGGVMVLNKTQDQPAKIMPVFKDMKADFLKRVDADAIFTCQDGEKVNNLIQKVIDTGERHHENLHIEVTAPEKYGDEILATFSLTLSLKVKD